MALGVLNSGAGLLGANRNGWGWGNGCNVYNGYSGCGNGFCGGSAFDMNVSEALAERDAEIARLNAKAYSDESDLAIYKYFDARLREIEGQIMRDKTEQVAFNSTVTANMSTVASQISTLQGLMASITKTAIPESVICNFNSRSGCNCGVTST